MRNLIVIAGLAMLGACTSNPPTVENAANAMEANLAAQAAALDNEANADANAAAASAMNGAGADYNSSVDDAAATNSH